MNARRSRHPTTTLLLAVMVAAVLTSCAGGDPPSSTDVPEIMAEAAGTKPAPKWGDSPARQAVRSSFRILLYFDSLHEAEVKARFQRPELKHYLMLPDSYVGGDFPRKIAGLLREVQQHDRDYLQRLQSFPSVLNERLARVELSGDQRRALEEEMTKAMATRHQPIIEVVSSFDTFVASTATLYELMAAHSGSIRSMRDGLEISDTRVLQRFNSLVDEVNNAHAAADAAIRRLAPEQQARFTRMGLTKRL